MTDKPDIAKLKDYYPWFQESGIHLVTYAGYKATEDLIIALFALLFPDFRVYKGAILLDYKFRQTTVDNWFDHFNGNIQHVESFLNSVEVTSSLFLHPLDDAEYHNVEYIGKKIKQSWEWSLKTQFPDKEFEVIGEKHDEFDDYVITFWQKQ